MKGTDGEKRVRSQDESPGRKRPFRMAGDKMRGSATVLSAENMLFGESPVLPLRRPDYSIFPLLWNGKVPCRFSVDVLFLPHIAPRCGTGRSPESTDLT